MPFICSPALLTACLTFVIGGASYIVVTNPNVQTFPIEARAVVTTAFDPNIKKDLIIENGAGDIVFVPVPGADFTFTATNLSDAALTLETNRDPWQTHVRVTYAADARTVGAVLLEVGVPQAVDRVVIARAGGKVERRGYFLARVGARPGGQCETALIDDPATVGVSGEAR